MNAQWFIACLTLVSILTGLVTEAIKKVLTEWNKTYQSNTLAGIVATILAVLTGIAYCIMTETQFTGQLAVMLIALVLLSWLCSMIGYDKVMQSIAQFTQSRQDNLPEAEDESD